MKQVREKIEEFSKIGMDEEGAVSRIFGSKFMKEGQAEIMEYFHKCGLKTWMDSVGNIHGSLECGKENAGEILIGSHLDTVKQGGIFDGLLGIVAGAEAIKLLKEEEFHLTKDIHIIATNGEEGNELGGTFGSRAMMGLLPCGSDEYLEKAAAYGYSKEDLLHAQMDTSHAKCYLELHIEQGPTLYNHGEKIGIVTGIVGLRRYRVTVYGIGNHAGTTMMEDREDALVAASRIILMGDELARRTGHNFVETVGVLSVFPGSAPVIPSRVEMILEIRNEDEKLMDDFMEEYQKQARMMAKIKIEPVVQKSPVKCSEKLIDITEKLCRQKQISYRKMPSGATHDGNAMALKMPVGMIFVPSKKGISHSKEEWTDWDDIDCGMEILIEVIKFLESREE
ncbi:MAG: Zn-dependent hydrolase [Lachnospiraceae bacterium]|nr:Zn-dependent hydrolase [Lachnospiraceae bacterium]